MYHIFCIHSSVEGHLGSFQFLAIINKAAMNIVEHVSLLQVKLTSIPRACVLLHVGASSGYMPSNAGSLIEELEKGLKELKGFANP